MPEENEGELPSEVELAVEVSHSTEPRGVEAPDAKALMDGDCVPGKKRGEPLTEAESAVEESQPTEPRGVEAPDTEVLVYGDCVPV